MILTTENILLIGALLLFVGILASKISSRFGTPMLLLFLAVGMLFGTDGLGIEFNSPRAAQFIGTISLCIILFSGGMDTKFTEIRPVLGKGITLATLGVVLTTLLTGTFIYFIGSLFRIELTFMEALLPAAIVSSTDSASVFSILRAKRQGLKENLRPLLELESGSNDPMAYVLTTFLIALLGGDGMGIGESIVWFLTQMGIGAIAGYLLGLLTVWTMEHINLSNKSLYSVLLLSLSFFIFSFTDLLGGNGYLAVYIGGLVVGNKRTPHKRHLMTFFDGVTWLMQIVMFIVLGLLVNPHELWSVALFGTIMALFITFIGRPVSVWIGLLPFRGLSNKAKTYIGWVGLRGAVPIIFATYPMVAGLAHADMIFNSIFCVVIISLIVQGSTVTKMAELLHLAEEEEVRGFDFDLPDDVKAALIERKLTEDSLANGNTLKELHLPSDTLVMMIRRGEEYIVPKGNTELRPDDILLFITPEKQAETKYDRRTLLRRLRKMNRAKRK
ncbi:MAG: potassium/proton antiporter [Tidjanibacter sp.]|nr:potassium/proton antiporter [Tidjanibacter sp.]